MMMYYTKYGNGVVAVVAVSITKFDDCLAVIHLLDVDSVHDQQHVCQLFPSLSARPPQ